MENNRDYLDAKFDGIEKLLTVQGTNFKDLLAIQEGNLKGYIGAVSANVNKVREDLQSHKDNQDAHGAAFGRRTSDKIATWGTVLIAAGALALSLWKHG